MQDFESESFVMRVDHSQKVKTTPITNDCGSKDCVNLSPSTAVSRVNQKIGIFGGTFDPIHFGHIGLAVNIKEFHHLDEVWFCPNFQSPLKQDLPTHADHRLKMLRIALENLPWAKVIDVELKRKGSSFTVETLQALHQDPENKDKIFYLILGDDALPTLHQWKDIEKIITVTPLLIGRRHCSLPTCPGSRALKEAVKKGLTPSDALMQIEATTIRKRIAEGLYCGHLLREKVLDYIYQNQLYSNGYGSRRSRNSS